jgi:hypothetical protein
MKSSRNLLENELVLNIGLVLIVFLLGKVTLYFIA